MRHEASLEASDSGRGVELRHDLLAGGSDDARRRKGRQGRPVSLLRAEEDEGSKWEGRVRAYESVKVGSRQKQAPNWS